MARRQYSATLSWEFGKLFWLQDGRTDFQLVRRAIAETTIARVGTLGDVGRNSCPNIETSDIVTVMMTAVELSTEQAGLVSKAPNSQQAQCCSDHVKFP